MPELDDLKKLPPGERIKKLQELEVKNKAEIEAAHKLIEESKREEVIAEELKEMPIPQLRSIDISSLFTPEEKQMFAAKRFVQIQEAPVEVQPTLERKVAEAQGTASEEQIRAAGPNYAIDLGSIYERIKGLADQVASGERLTRAELSSFYNYENLLDKVNERISANEHYMNNEKIKQVLEGANEVIDRARSYFSRGGV